MPQTKQRTPTMPTLSALLISPVEEDHQTLGILFRDQDWTLHSAHSLGSASTMLRKTLTPVVITERDLPVGNWKDVLEVMQSLPDPPLVIVTSLHADERLWAEALNLGAYDVIAKPFGETELVRILNSIWLRSQSPSPSPSRKTAPAFSVSRASTAA
jgi:DNA-binding response OmpR family regulator